MSTAKKTAKGSSKSKATKPFDERRLSKPGTEYHTLL
jgi:hypothetical protein